MAIILEGVNDDLIIRQNQRIEILSNTYYKLTQFLVWPIVYIPSLIFFKLRITGKENLVNLKSPFIVASNHISIYDAFLFRLIFPFHYLPLRFMAVKEFEWKFLNFLAKIKIIDFVYALFGVFIIVKGRGVPKNLAESKKIIKLGGNVAIYPEGRINKSEIISNFKFGAVMLAQQTGAPIVPISFKLERGQHLRRLLKINIGAPFTISGAENIIVSTANLQKLIEKLNKS